VFSERCEVKVKSFRVRPKTLWIGESAAKGYLQEDLKEAFARYIPKSQARAMLDELTVVAEPAEVRSSEFGVRSGENGNCEAGFARRSCSLSASRRCTSFGASIETDGSVFTEAKSVRWR